jgi:hypothetical protein
MKWQEVRENCTMRSFIIVLFTKCNQNHLVMDEMSRACSTHGEKRNAYRVLVGKPEGKRPLGRPRRWWEDNIRVDLRGVGWGGMDWIHLA